MAGDFSKMKTNRGKVSSAIAQATARKGQQGTASPEEAKNRADQMKTQGRKGCKAVRINMAFTPDNYEFIRVMSKLRGETQTAFVNYMIDRFASEHGAVFEDAKKLIDKL